MNLLRSLPKKSRMLVLLMFFIPMPVGNSPTTVSGQTKSPHENTSGSTTNYDKDSYEIYATLLASEKHTMYVIQAEIYGYPGMTRKNLGIEGDKEFIGEWGAVMDDYAKQNQTEKRLQKSFPLQAPYELIPESSIFPAEHGQKGWDDYYLRYPSSGGFYSFSAVGFNPARTRAIVDMGHHCGMLCGNGGPHFFEKKNEKWREVSVKATVMEWVS